MVMVEFNQSLIRKWKSLIVIETSDELVGHGRYASYCTPGKICLYINDCYYVWRCWARDICYLGPNLPYEYVKIRANMVDALMFF